MEELEDYLRRSLRTDPIDVPRELDRAILDAARRPRPRLRAWQIAAPLALTAAAAAMAFLLLPPLDRSAPRRYDIVDAYQLALQLEAGDDPDGRWDLNADGVIDERDVRRVAELAVALSGTEDA